MKQIVLLALALCGVAAAQPSCTTQMVAGTYVSTYTGWVTVVAPGAAPVTYSGGIFGITSIGFDGKVTGTGTVMGMGPIADYDVAGTIAIKPDCTGTITLAGRPKGSTGPATMVEVDRFVYLPDANEFRLIIWDMGPATYPALFATWQRISRQPNAASW